MRIEIPHYTERFGAVRIYNVQHVFELDTGMSNEEEDFTQMAGQTIRCIPYDVINGIEKQMAVVIPCKQERLKVLEGVFCGIPHDCLTILVSNSSREPIDRFQMERETFSQFCQFVQRSAILIHQRDQGLAKAFQAAGYTDILDKEGLVRHGKAEGMIIGLVIARLCGKDYVGFVDADNYVPGAVNEYVKEFAAGFHMAQTPYAMVRISWHSKPKIIGSELFFPRWGRASEVTNRFLNELVAYYSGFGTEVVKTGNAGEHAFSMALGQLMAFSSGYSVEPYELINLIEQFGGVYPSPHQEVMEAGVEVFQIETRNPHFHEDKGSSHVEQMRTIALETLYHSSVCPHPLKEGIEQYLKDEGMFQYKLKKPRIYPPLMKMDQGAFFEVLDREGESFEQILRVIPKAVVEEPPISWPEAESSPDGTEAASEAMSKEAEDVKPERAVQPMSKPTTAQKVDAQDSDTTKSNNDDG